MLISLQVKDYALIENIQINFGKGLNIITGETGAGKSILIDAMGLLLGDRASTEIVRKGANKSIVEGIFNVGGNKKIEQLLVESDIEFLPELIVRREISLKGSNRCFLNDTPVSLNLIKEAGNLLVDLHGQHEHQSLLRTDTHIEMLDDFSDDNKLQDEFYTQSRKLNSLLKEKRELTEKESLLKEKKDLYLFQIKEIDEVAPIEDEEENLEEELIILENTERLASLSSDIYSALYENDNSITDQLFKIKNKLSELKEIDKAFKEKEDECNSSLALINEIADFVRSYKDKIDVDPNRVKEVRDRLGALTMLKKKYGGSLKVVIQHREMIGKEVDLAENFSDRINDLESEIDDQRILCGKIAKRISSARLVESEKIKSEIEEALKYLGISKALFKTIITQTEVLNSSEDYIIVDDKKYKFNSNGFDNVEFFISTNIGEDPKPLAKVASGGEISRIMLALKSILAKNDKLPLLIFDEIDTGVSGQIAQKVGLSLKLLAEYHQIIAITHLPQIAGLADYHYSVEKKSIGERVVSSIRILDTDARVREVAKLMSGENVTDASLEGARELMGINI